MKGSTGTYDGLTYNDFKKTAKSRKLSEVEKIGFTKESRTGFEDYIIQDLLHKLPNLKKKNQSVLDIGCGSGELAKKLIGYCQKIGNTISLIDSQEMLNNVPNSKNVHKIAGRFPDEIKIPGQKFDVIVVYSVFHYVIGQGCMFSFLDGLIQLLNESGQAIIGDIPSLNKRRRFLESKNGKEFHKKNFPNLPLPIFEKFSEYNSIDDTVIMALLTRARALGIDAYVMPQNKNLFFANRREDIVLYKP